MPVTNSKLFKKKCEKALEVANQFLRMSPDWVTFFREMLGVNGAAKAIFPTHEEYVQFEMSEEFQEIQRMVGALRHQGIRKRKETTRVLTIRIPESLHEALKAESKEHAVSMNKLCTSKLLYPSPRTEHAEFELTNNDTGSRILKTK